MKKILIYLSAAASLLVLSCSRAEMESPVTTVPEWNGEGAAIFLGAKSAEGIPTKAERPGDDDGSFNENKVYTLDYFIYDVDPSLEANQSTDALLKGRLTFSGIEPTTDEIAKQNAQVVDLASQFGETKNTCYVYVIANLPGAEDSAKNYFAWNEDGALVYYASADAEGTVIGTTWADLQTVKIITDFKNSLDGGKFKAQKSFVMSGFSGPVTLSGKGADEVIVDLDRLASKVSLKTNVIKLVDKYTFNTATHQLDYVDSYFPNIDHIQIYLNYVDPQGTIDAALDTYQTAYYFSYNRNAYIPEINPDGSFMSQVVKKNTDGSIVIDDSGNAVYEDGPAYPAYEVTGTPFYSYPTQWDTRETTAPFIKIIIPWIAYDVPASLRSKYTTFNSDDTFDIDPTSDAYKALEKAVLGGNFPNDEIVSLTFDGQTYEIDRKTKAENISTRYGDEYYYKISIPAWLKENDKNACALQANNWYQIDLDISVLGSETDDAEMSIDGSTMGLMVCDWSDPREDMGGDLDGGRYLSVASKEYTVNAVNSITIPVISSHTLSASIISREVWVNGAWVTTWTSGYYRNGARVTVNHSTANRGSVTASGTSSVTLTNELNNAVDQNLDCYMFKFVIEITQTGGTGTPMSETVTVIQYPSIYLDSKPGGNVMIDGYYGNVDSHFHGTGNAQNPGGNSGTSTSSSNITQTPYAPISNYVNTQTNMTVLSISSLANNPTYTIDDIGETFTYLIADPRQPSGYQGNDLTPHFRGNYNQTNAGDRLVAWTDAEAAAIKLGSTTVRNFIAPRFMVSSRWGRMGNWQPGTMSNDDRLETVQKRCATYQEAGYPAGRWRLPTEAEIAFIAKMQQFYFINSLFTADGYSIAATGNVFTVANNGSIGYNRNQGSSCRCVYDLWYWGDEPADGAQSTYTIAVE